MDLRDALGPGSSRAMSGRCLSLWMLVFWLGGCALLNKDGSDGDESMAWLDLGPGSVELCLSGFENGPRLRESKSVLPRAREHMLAQEPEKATEWMADLDSHPQVEVHRAAAELLNRQTDQAWIRLRALLEEWPEDACLLQLAGITRLLQGEYQSALSLSNDALSFSSGHPEMLFFQAVTLSQMGQADESASVLRSTLEANPAHEGAAAMLAVDYLQRGDGELAVPLLEVAFEGGMEVSALLAPAYYDAGRLDDYLRVASRSGWPLGDQGRLAEAESPMDALAEQLGVGPLGRLYAELDTSMGTLRCELFWKQVPVTVANFVGLSRGGLDWQHPVSGEISDQSLYSGTRLHRVIPRFMIQGGDPIGVGTGGPGYSFPDEIFPSHRFDEGGVLAMANSGPHTNGSQWFITEVPTPHLNGRHTIFGQCDESTTSLVKTIAEVDTDASDRPFEDVIIHEIRIVGD